MEKFEFIYRGIDFVITIFSMLMIYRFVYGFSIERIKKVVPYFLIFIFVMQIIFAANNIHDDITILFLYITISVLLILCVKKKRIKNMFWIFPISFVGCIPSLIFALMYKGFTDKNILNSDSIVLVFISNLLTLLSLGVIYLYEKKYCFSSRIRSTERITISITSTFISFLAITLCNLETISVFGKYSRIFMFSLGIIAIVIIYVVIKLMVKSNSADYYMQLNRLNEKNMENLLNHFEAYKVTQENTRRVKHDMKNHLSCIKILSEENKIAEIKEYINTLTEEIHNKTDDIQIGLSIVDAILNEKYHLAQKEDIVIEVDGRLERLDRIKPIDWCIIFSNAIDNAIEALIKLPKEMDRKILIKIKRNRNQILICIENYCIKNIVIINNKVISQKKDKEYHGFGIENIKFAVKKYDGDIGITCDKDMLYFKMKLNILIPLDS